MKLGIMSDSHGRVQPVRRALQLFDAHDVGAIVHCGDVGGLPVFEELAGRRCWFVWGNTDLPRPSWRAELEALGLAWPDGPVTFSLKGRKVAVFHGHEPEFGQAIEAGQHEYLLHGHTHRRDDRRVGGTRVINPGALHRATIKTVAVLDLVGDQLEFLQVDA